MQYKQIGNVILDYTYYKGEDLYTDGIIEDELLNIVKEKREKEILYSSSQWSVLYHLSDLRENIIEWYPFCDNAKILEIGAGCGAITGLLSRKAMKVVSIELSEKRSLINAYRNCGCKNIKIILGNFQDIKLEEKFDYITLIGVWEYAKTFVDDKQPYLKMLEIAKKYLKENGKIIIAIENKMGLKYWNGAAEDHTGILYSGLNDYIESDNVRTFSKQEIEKMFQLVGISKYKFYYPMPDYKLPEIIYSDEVLPKPGWERNYRKDFSTSRFYNFYDAIIFDQICSDNMFPYFANSFLIIIGDEKNSKKYVKYDKTRKKQYRIKTEMISKNNQDFVIKSALNETAKKHILKLKENEEKWKDSFPRLKCIEGRIEKDSYIVPYIEGINLETLFYEYRSDINLFIEKFIYYINNYLMPAKDKFIPFHISDEFVTIFGEKYPANPLSLHCTNIDMTFSNLILDKYNQLYCFDIEWFFEFLIPYEYVIWRSAKFLYEKYMIYLKNQISKEKFYELIGITKGNSLIYEEMEKNFINCVVKKKNYLENYRKPSIMQKIRFS